MARLFIMGMPLGQITDLSIQALETINRETIFFVEDTRSFQNFLKKLTDLGYLNDYKGKILISCYQEIELAKIPQILDYLDKGKNVVLASEAGMPTVSDPGARLIEAVRRSNHELRVLPGPTAITTALALSGYSYQEFFFLGFLPKKATEKKKLFTAWQKNPLVKKIAIVFYESPQRIFSTYKMLSLMFPKQKMFLGKDLTKSTQELIWLIFNGREEFSCEEKGEWTGVLMLN